jgi:hypothetical protein
MVEEAIICKFRAFFMVNIAIDEKQSGLTQLASCSSAAQHCAEPERSMNSLLSLKDDRRPVSSMTLGVSWLNSKFIFQKTTCLLKLTGVG